MNRRLFCIAEASINEDFLTFPLKVHTRLNDLFTHQQTSILLFTQQVEFIHSSRQTKSPVRPS